MENFLALKNYNHSKNINCLIFSKHQREGEISKRINNLFKNAIRHRFLKLSKSAHCKF